MTLCDAVLPKASVDPLVHAGVSASLCARHWVQAALGDFGVTLGDSKVQYGQSPERAVSRGDESFSPQSSSWLRRIEGRRAQNHHLPHLVSGSGFSRRPEAHTRKVGG